jgi:hypothetical protein
VLPDVTVTEELLVVVVVEDEIMALQSSEYQEH